MPRWMLGGFAASLVLFSAAGCAGTAGSPGEPAELPEPVAASAEVLGQGTVLQREGEAPQFCLGGVAESYPPQCSGPEVPGWDWEAAGYSESASGVTWGAYALVGSWDGVSFTPTREAVPLALYDPPMPEPDPREDPENAGSTPEARLIEIQEEVHALDRDDILTSTSANGHLFVTVVYDDGSLQRYFDAAYGADVVAVQSALRPAE